MTLGEHDAVVGSWAEAPSGPGWSNQLIWVCVRSGLDGTHRVEAIQPEDQTPGMLEIFDFCRLASDRLRLEVRAMPAKRGRRSNGRR